MAVVDVPVHEWREFFDAFSRRHRAWLTRIEPRLSGSGHPLPLGAVTIEGDDGRTSAIEITFAGDSGADAIRIDNPAVVRVRQAASGEAEAVEIIDDQGESTRLAFRAAPAAEMLDGLAPAEIPE